MRSPIHLSYLITFFIIFLNKHSFGKYLHFSKWINSNPRTSLNLFVFETHVALSAEGCIETCSAKKMCEYINYRTRSRVCVLIGVTNATSPIEDYVEKKRGYVFWKKEEWDTGEYDVCEGCNPRGVCSDEIPKPEQYSICQDSGCGPPEAKRFAVIHGNMFSIGDKVRYSCKVGYTPEVDDNDTITCQASGNWTESAFTCNYTQSVIAEGDTCFMGMCYILVATPMSWQDAKQHCDYLGGRLVYIKSAEEWDFVLSVVLVNATNDTVWLGAEDSGLEGIFKWQDGSLVSDGFMIWRLKQPNNLDELSSTVEANCMAGKTTGVNKGWVDNFCGRKYESVCKFK